MLWVLASQCSSVCSHQRWSRRSFIIGAIPRRPLPPTPDHTSPGSINQRRLLLTRPLIFSTLGLLRQASKFFKEEKYGKSIWQILDSMQRAQAPGNVQTNESSHKRRDKRMGLRASAHQSETSPLLISDWPTHISKLATIFSNFDWPLFYLYCQAGGRRGGPLISLELHRRQNITN